MKQLFSYGFKNWWLIPLISATLIGLSFIFDNIWFIIIGLLLVTISVIYQFIKKGWKTGCLTGLTMLVIIALSAFWFFLQLFPSPGKIHRQYSKRYENRTEIQRIIGVEIPKFKIVDSKLIHFNESGDFEFEVQTTIEFKELPDDKLFEKLDSIIIITIPQEPNENSSFFYYGLENIYRCWSKDGNKYEYERNTDFGEKFLHSKDAYFKFEFIKGVKTAKIVYGNY
jgi:membrane protein implicated in regulation of membrane protease activity